MADQPSRSSRREAYLQKLRDPRWQKKRLEVFERDDWRCQNCKDSDSTLHVHHRWYEQGREPWDYPKEALITLCEECHAIESHDRPQAEANLIHALRRVCFADEINRLATAFMNMRPCTNYHKMLIWGISLLLIDPGLQKTILGELSFSLKEFREKEISGNPSQNGEEVQ